MIADFDWLWLLLSLVAVWLFTSLLFRSIIDYYFQAKRKYLRDSFADLSRTADEIKES